MDTTLDITLTAEDIAALRMAEDITAHHYKGRSYLRGYLRDYSDGRIFTAKEQRLFNHYDSALGRTREVTCEAFISGHSKPSDPEGFGGSWRVENDDTEAACFASIGWRRDAMRSILALVRPGDTLALHWHGGENTVNLNRAYLYADSLTVGIKREGKPEQTFLVTYSVCPDNSARMVRRKGWMSGND